MKGNGRSRRLRVVAGGESLVSSAGGSLLMDTAHLVGLDTGLRQALMLLAAAARQARAGQGAAGPGGRGRAGRGLPR